MKGGVRMTHSALASVPAPEFDAFLFAPIGEDRNGMLLSVVSALARLNVDPWQEAAQLAGLPGDTATRRLASLITALPDRPSAHLDASDIAARLISLLPRRGGSDIAPRQTSIGAGPATNFQAAIYVIIWVSFLSLVLGDRPMTGGDPPAGVDNADTSASSTVAPSMPPPGSGQ
jgi:hypothetical protein